MGIFKHLTRHSLNSTAKSRIIRDILLSRSANNFCMKIICQLGRRENVDLSSPYLPPPFLPPSLHPSILSLPPYLSLLPSVFSFSSPPPLNFPASFRTFARLCQKITNAATKPTKKIWVRPDDGRSRDYVPIDQKNCLLLRFCTPPSPPGTSLPPLHFNRHSSPPLLPYASSWTRNLPTWTLAHAKLN